MIQYSRTISDAEQKILEHDLLDITDWINQAINGKIISILKRGANEYRQILKLENSPTLPTSDNVAFDSYSKRPDYKNRKTREDALKK